MTFKSVLGFTLYYTLCMPIGLIRPTVSQTMEEDKTDHRVSGSWIKMSGNNRPPYDDNSSYLYMNGPHKKMDIVFTQTTSPNFRTMGIEISMRYWASWDESKFATCKQGTELFQIAVMPCQRSMPATKFMLFDGFNRKEWLYQTYTASEKGLFSYKCDKRVEIEVSDNEDNLERITPEDKYFVALKDINIRYIYSIESADPSNQTDSVNNSAVPATMIDISCLRDNCASFQITGGKWSPKYLPTIAEDLDFYYTVNPGEDLIINLPKGEEGSMPCISMDYWATGQALLEIHLKNGSEPLILGSTQTFDTTSLGRQPTPAYQWQHLDLCPGQFILASKERESWIRLRSSVQDEDQDLIAVSFNLTQNVWESQYKKIYNYLNHWSKPESREEWFTLSPYLQRSSSENETSYDVMIPGDTIGFGYLFSKWFKYTRNQVLRYTIISSNLRGNISITYHLFNSEFQELTSSQLINSRLKVSLNSRYNRDSEKIDGHGLKKDEPAMILLAISFNSTGLNFDQKITLMHFDLSDGCREGDQACSNHGTCVNLEPDQYRCDCDLGRIGPHCELIDYCKTIDPASNSTGEQFCLHRGGQCDPDVFTPEIRVCSCGKMQFWNPIETGQGDDDYQPGMDSYFTYLTLNGVDFPQAENRYSVTPSDGQCFPVARCVGMAGLCPEGYACDDEYWSEEEPCQICDRDRGYTMYDGSCVKVDSCYKKCGSAKCRALGVRFYCFCEGDLELGEDGKSCRPRNNCTAWDSQLHGCSQSCVRDQGAVQCQCFDGYTLAEDGRTCQANFECKESCPEGSICMQPQVLLDRGDGSNETVESSALQCGCKSGWVWDDVTQSCIDICQMADRGDETWQQYIHDICGTPRCHMFDGKSIQCICSPPTITNKQGLCELEKICLPDNRGYVDCQQRNALCEPRLNGSNYSYRCLCSPGKKFRRAKCVDQCSQEKISECAALNAVCRVVDQLSTSTHPPVGHAATSEVVCACRPGFIMDDTGYCYLAVHSIKVRLTVKITDRSELMSLRGNADDLWESFCANIDRKILRDCHLYIVSVLKDWIHREREIIAHRTINRYVDRILGPDMTRSPANLIHSVTLIDSERNGTSDDYLGQDFNLTISLQMRGKPKHWKPTLLEAICEDVFGDKDPRSGYCLIPTDTLVKKMTIEEQDLIPCAEENIDYCPADTKCLSSNDETKYRCACARGFKSQAVLRLDKVDRRLTKEFCEDIDECSFRFPDICPENSFCRNTRGSFECVCNHNFKNISGQCLDICELQSCVHGKCFVTTNQTAICKCESWYYGEKCDIFDKQLLIWRTLMITVTVTLSFIVLVCFVVIVILYRRSKETVFENGYLKKRSESPSSLHLHNINPSLRRNRTRNSGISTNFDLGMN